MSSRDSGALDPTERVFGYDRSIWRQVPSLRVAALTAVVSDSLDLTAVVESARGHVERARAELAGRPESSWPAIQGWRRVFSALGVPPTRYRCASEALLRRLRTNGALPSVHPVVDVCNAVSARHGIPIIVLDLDRVGGSLTVRPSDGTESWLAFDGAVLHPAPGEINFIDANAHAHSLKWCHRQSARSAVSPTTSQLLIVAEAVHESGASDLTALTESLTWDLAHIGVQIRTGWVRLGPDSAGLALPAK